MSSLNVLMKPIIKGKLHCSKTVFSYNICFSKFYSIIEALLTDLRAKTLLIDLCLTK